MRYWVEVKQRAIELLGNGVRPGIDYALTEVVHCPSRSEIGVNEALSECARHYLHRVVELSGAKVIVVLGSKAEVAMKSEFSIPGGDMFGPALIGGRQRYFVFLPHPNAHMVRSFAKCIHAEKLQELRAFLR